MRVKDMLILLRSAERSARVGHPGATCGVDPVHQAAMKLYLDSWVANYIKIVANALEGDKEAIGTMRAIAKNQR